MTKNKSTHSRMIGRNISRLIGVARAIKLKEKELAELKPAPVKGEASVNVVAVAPVHPASAAVAIISELRARSAAWEAESNRWKNLAEDNLRAVAIARKELEDLKRRKLANFSIQDIEWELARREREMAERERTIQNAIGNSLTKQ